MSKRIWQVIIIFFSLYLVVSIILIPLRLFLTSRKNPQAQAILVLGGSTDRIIFAGHFFQKHPKLPVLISDRPHSFLINQEAVKMSGLKDKNIYYDFCATDTVTNFTCILNYLNKKHIKHLYLVTSDYHMARSKVIAFFVLGSRDIIVTPIVVPSLHGSSARHESFWRIVRDSVRSIIWIFSRKTGASLNPNITH